MNTGSLSNILQAIENGTIGERNRAIERLREFPFEQIKDYLFDGLRSNHFRVRSQCAQLLSEKGDETIIFPLLQAMSDESWAIRNSAKEALIQFGEDLVIPVLRGIAESSAGNTTLLKAIASVLAQYDHPDATSVLVTLFEGTEDPELIEAVTTAIGKKEDERSIVQLFHLLAHEHWNVRKAAANALTAMPFDNIKNHFALNLGNSNRFIHLATIEILISRAGDEVLDLVADTFKSNNVTAKLNALSVLSGIHSDESMMTMVSVLGDSNITIRNKAIEELSRTKSEAVFNLLKRCLNSTNDLLKQGAILTLGRIADDESIEILQALLEKENGMVKVSILESLASIGNRRCIQMIVHHSAIPDHASDVSRILRSLEPDLTIQQLINLLEEPNYFATAVKALIELDRTLVLRYLSSKLTSGTPVQQEKVVEAMGLMGSRDSIPYLEKILEGGFSSRIMQIAETGMRRIRKSG
ncbi:HEAT repeat domain-containing protein [bacterium]|nr:HEAT repeat domain-containing protein [candidate division CSSED10-310 bacterium]